MSFFILYFISFKLFVLKLLTFTRRAMFIKFQREHYSWASYIAVLKKRATAQTFLFSNRLVKEQRFSRLIQSSNVEIVDSPTILLESRENTVKVFSVRERPARDAIRCSSENNNFQRKPPFLRTEGLFLYCRYLAVRLRCCVRELMGRESSSLCFSSQFPRLFLSRENTRGKKLRRYTLKCDR